MIHYHSLYATAILLQNPTEVYCKMSQVFYYKMQQLYYKMWQLLQIASILSQNATFTKICDMTQDGCISPWILTKKNAYAEEQIVSVAKSGKYQIADYECQTIAAQPVITCSKLTIETLEQSVKYVKS